MVISKNIDFFFLFKNVLSNIRSTNLGFFSYSVKDCFKSTIGGFSWWSCWELNLSRGNLTFRGRGQVIVVS